MSEVIRHEFLGGLGQSHHITQVDDCPVCRLEAANAAKDRALGKIARGNWALFSIDEIKRIARAALSSAGEGWVRREVLAQKIEALGAVVFAEDDKEREMLAKCVVLTVIRNAPVDTALAALEKGK